MRIQEILQIGIYYLIVGAVAVCIALGLGYGIIYRKLMKGSKRLTVKQLILAAAFMIYVVVVLGVTLVRGQEVYGGLVNFHIFRSYREAWNNFSYAEWRNIILNILLFVPLGFLLPWLFYKARKWWIVYLICIGTSVVIEFLQMITRRGVFDLDDIMNNTLGGMIGYGLLVLFMRIRDKVRRQHLSGKQKQVLIYCQIPLVVAVIGFSTIFIVYQAKELGNLSSTYLNRQDMSGLKVSSVAEMNQEAGTAEIYQAVIGTKEDMLNTAEEVFAVVGVKVEPSNQIVYDDVTVYYSKDNAQTVWVYSKGLRTWFTDANVDGEDRKGGLTFDEVRQILAAYLVEVPEEAEFTDEGGGYYTMIVDMVEADGNMLDGICTVNIGENNEVSNITNDIITYQKYKKVEIISEQEAYEQLLDGKFNGYYDEDISEIEVVQVKSSYELDSKGFYQPVYKFMLDDREESIIIIPALRKF